MATPIGRRIRRGVGKGAIPLQSRVAPEVHRRAHLAAERLGISVSAYLELLVCRDELDETGRPLWEVPPEMAGAEPLPGLGLSA